MIISSPMGSGSGAHVIHQCLARNIPGYHLQEFNPNWALFPPALFLLSRPRPFPDIIHTTPDCGLFFKQKGIPLVITFHNYVLDGFMQQYSFFPQRVYYRTLLRYFTNKSLEHAAAVTSVSFFTADLVRKELHSANKIRVIYNGIDTEMFCPAPRKRGDSLKVLFSGNLTARKGAHWLAGIADELNKGITILYTSGLRTNSVIPERPNLVNIGQVPFSRMPDVYRDADILLFPTVREGFGLAAAEAMACGLPVVATNCSSLPEIVVDGKSGYLCELGNVKDFARRINELADSPSLRKEMGFFNRNRIEKKFNLAQMLQGYRNLFSELQNSRSN